MFKIKQAKFCIYFLVILFLGGLCGTFFVMRDTKLLYFFQVKGYIPLDQPDFILPLAVMSGKGNPIMRQLSKPDRIQQITFNHSNDVTVTNLEVDKTALYKVEGAYQVPSLNVHCFNMNLRHTLDLNKEQTVILNSIQFHTQDQVFDFEIGDITLYISGARQPEDQISLNSNIGLTYGLHPGPSGCTYTNKSSNPIQISKITVGTFSNLQPSITLLDQIYDDTTDDMYSPIVLSERQITDLENVQYMIAPGHTVRVDIVFADRDPLYDCYFFAVKLDIIIDGKLYTIFPPYTNSGHAITGYELKEIYNKAKNL